MERVITEFIDDFSQEIDDEHIYRLREKGFQENTPVIDLNVGRMLYFFIQIFRPKTCIDIGLGGGLSLCYMAKAVHSYGGSVISLEINKYRIDEFKDHIKKKIIPYFNDNIRIIHANAVDYLKKNDLELGFAFVDGMKKEYTEYFKYIKRKIIAGGIIVIDNIFYSGRSIFLAQYEKNVKKYKAPVSHMRSFIEKVKGDHDFEKLLLSESDGVLVLRKN
ncbi:O-methyltransferase [Spirochaetota bacterium]